jgi:hypothetical protein
MTAVFAVSPSTGETRAAALPGVPRAEQTNYSVCFAAADNWSLDRGYCVEGKTAGHLDWLALARDGLRLNSPAETTEKIRARGIGTLPPPGAPHILDSFDAPLPIYPVAHQTTVVMPALLSSVGACTGRRPPRASGTRSGCAL